MDNTFLEWVVGQTGMAGLAGLALYMQNRTWIEALRRERESAEQHRNDKQLLLSVLSEHTKMTAELKATIQHLIDGKHITPVSRRRTGDPME